jgi:hypothetical protein
VSSGRKGGRGGKREERRGGKREERRTQLGEEWREERRTGGKKGEERRTRLVLIPARFDSIGLGQGGGGTVPATCISRMVLLGGEDHFAVMASVNDVVISIGGALLLPSYARRGLFPRRRRLFFPLAK